MEPNSSQICLYHQNASTTIENIQSKVSNSNEVIKSYKRRFWMLFLFSTLSVLCGMVGYQFTCIANVIVCYYGVSTEAVNWTALIPNVIYIVLVFPVSWLMKKTGLKVTIIIGSVFNTIAYAVQFACLSPDSFAYVMVSAFFGSLSDVFVLAIPPCLAAVWFPSTEISRACAMGVFGNQLGTALGFVVPPLLIPGDCSNENLIVEGMRHLAIIITSANAFILLLIILTFQNEPKLPPSISQAEKKNINESYLHSSISMAKNVDFMLIFIMYGLNVGVNFTFSTLINEIFLRFFKNADVIVGWLGLVVTASGLVGSIVAGYILDYTHKFKETSFAICFLSFVFYAAFSCLLHIDKIWVQFITIAVLGFFLTSFLPVGFEYGIEVTYPESEMISASLLNSSTMIFGTILTEVASHVLQNMGPNYANGVMCGALLMATVISCFITKNYKRSKKNFEFHFEHSNIPTLTRSLPAPHKCDSPILSFDPVVTKM